MSENNFRNTGIAIIIGIIFSIFIPIGILIVADFNPWFAIIIPICVIILGMILLFVAYVRLAKPNSKRKLAWFVNKGTVLVIGNSLLTTGIVMLVVESIFYSVFGIFLAFAWFLLL